MPEQATRRLMAGAVLIVAAIAAVVSYIHIENLALSHGHLAALLLPISVDGMISAASLALLYAARAGLPSPWLGRLMLGLGVASTVAAKAVEGACGEAVGVMVSAWLAVAFIGGHRIARMDRQECTPERTCECSPPCNREWAPARPVGSHSPPQPECTPPGPTGAPCV